MIPLLFSTASTTIRFSRESVKVALVHWSHRRPPKGRFIATQPAAPPIFDWGLEPQPGLFEETIVVQDLFTMSQLVDFKQWPSILEQLAQTHEPVGA